MSSKIARNVPCPCGSGKKYKYCHGSVANIGEASVQSVVMQFHYSSIILTPELSSGGTRIVVNGELSHEDDQFPFMMVVEPLESGEFRIQQFGWQTVPPITDKQAVARQLLSRLGYCLEPLTVEAQEAGNGSGNIDWVPLQSGGDLDSPHLVTLRPGLGRLPGPAWSALWERISLKVRGDGAFRVPGFDVEQIERAFEQLQLVFTPDWLESRFREAAGGDTDVTMAWEFPHEAGPAWFPAYHLSRLAMGVICRGPALHTLVDLGLSLDELVGFPGQGELRRALAGHPESHHQVSLASQLNQSGHLLTLASVDAGPPDLKVLVHEQPYLVRTREVTLQNLVGDVLASLQPEETEETEAPVILHAVVSESSWYRPDFELPAELDQIEMPGNVRAVVIGRRFLDAGGGRLKRNAQKIIHNPKAFESRDDAALEALFDPDYHQVQEPALNVGSDFYVF